MKKIQKLQFFIILFILLFLTGMFNYLIDPYGRYGTDILDMNRIDARTWVVNKLSDSYESLELLLFGSSRCLGLNANYHPDVPGMNVALYGGAIEDHYCILRYAVDDLKYNIKYIVVGLEPALFSNNHPINMSLERNKVLNRWLLNENRSRIQSYFQQPPYVSGIASLLSITSLKDSLKIVLKYILENIGVKEASAAAPPSRRTDGIGSLFEKIAQAKDSMQARLRQYRKIYSGAAHLSEKRLRYLYQFARFAQGKGMQVIMFYPGYSMEFWEEMEKIHAFTKMHESLENQMEKIQQEYGWKIIDFRPKNWEGPELGFFDGVHPTKDTIQIIDETIGNVVNSVI